MKPKGMGGNEEEIDDEVDYQSDPSEEGGKKNNDED